MKKMIVNGIGVGITPITPKMSVINPLSEHLRDQVLYVPFQDVPRQYVAYLTDTTRPFSAEAIVFLNLAAYLFAGTDTAFPWQK